MRRDFIQAGLLAVLGAMFGAFVVTVANTGVVALASFLWIGIALGLLIHFGSKAWQFFYIHAPILIGLGVGYWLALGKPLG